MIREIQDSVSSWLMVDLFPETGNWVGEVVGSWEIHFGPCHLRCGRERDRQWEREREIKVIRNIEFSLHLKRTNTFFFCTFPAPFSIHTKHLVSVYGLSEWFCFKNVRLYGQRSVLREKYFLPLFFQQGHFICVKDLESPHILWVNKPFTVLNI